MTPDPGMTDLRLFLYADGVAAGTVTQYRRATVESGRLGGRRILDVPAVQRVGRGTFRTARPRVRTVGSFPAPYPIDLAGAGRAADCNRVDGRPPRATGLSFSTGERAGCINNYSRAS